MFPLPLFILMELYALTISLFERAMATHNFIAFYSLYVNPWEGLIGSNGITPAKEMMKRVKLRGWNGRNDGKIYQHYYGILILMSSFAASNWPA